MGGGEKETAPPPVTAAKKTSAGLSIRPDLVRRCVGEALSRPQEPEEMIQCA